MESKLPKEQTKYLDFLVKKYINITEYQAAYIDCLKTEKAVKEKGETYLWNNIDWFSLVNLPETQANNIYKEFINQQTILNEYTKWLSSQPKIDLGLGIPVAQTAIQDKKVEKKIEEKKEEKKVIKIYIKNFSIKSLNLKIKIFALERSV